VTKYQVVSPTEYREDVVHSTHDTLAEARESAVTLLVSNLNLTDLEV